MFVKDVLFRANKKGCINGKVQTNTDYGYLLSKWDKNLPSLILFRNFSTIIDNQFNAIQLVAKEYKAELEGGCIIVIETEKIRIRQLPIY